MKYYPNKWEIYMRKKKMAKKSNKHLSFEKDPEKTYVYIKDGKKEIGMLCWHFKKKKWVFEENRK